jgi:hypothetical protein
MITRGHCGAITGRLIEICGNNFERYRLLYYLFPFRWPSLTGVTSKSLKNWEWYALYKWTDVHKNEESGEWTFHPALLEEINLILALDIESEALTYDPDSIPGYKESQDSITQSLGVQIDEPEEGKKSIDQMKMELGYDSKEPIEPEETLKPTVHETFDPTRGMPFMECGHEADMFTPQGLPYCGSCAQLTNVPEAFYQRKQI